MCVTWFLWPEINVYSLMGMYCNWGLVFNLIYLLSSWMDSLAAAAEGGGDPDLTDGQETIGKN